MKKIISGITAIIFIAVTMLGAVPVQAAEANTVGSDGYTYKITPVLDPFNIYFFVETENPDPNLFRFVDKTTVYKKDADAYIQFNNTAYADIRYDDPQTLRVNGGYIFCDDYGYTDGGEVALQIKTDPYSGWQDTGVTFTLPALVDEADYLVNTYADKEGFFENMDAVQWGFSSICLYSGSYIRGELKRTDEYWICAATGHIDQSLYIYSPYEREDSKRLFASSIYPFRYDSLGFPSMMGKVSQRLDSSSSYQWNSDSHYLVDVTYNGETKSYGGAGNVGGQGISEDKIKQYFTFGENGTKISLDGTRTLLIGYSNEQMEDDIPRDDALTWKQISDTVGEGAWVRVSGSAWKTNGKWDLSHPVYTYLYTINNGTDFSSSEFGTGNSTYWGGDLGYSKDVWVDGRYVDVWRQYVQGEKFEDHPTSNVFLTEFNVPQIKYTSKWKQNELEYEVTSVTEKTKRVLFNYQSDKDVWTADRIAFDDGCATYYIIEKMVSQGKLDKKYLDMVTLTRDEVQKLNVDRNTDVLPDSGFVFDGTLPCGTPFVNRLIGDVNSDGVVDILDAVVIQKSAADIITLTDSQKEIADVNNDGSADVLDAVMIQKYATGKITEFKKKA